MTTKRHKGEDEPARTPSGDFDVRRYIPRLAHVMAYMSPAAAEQRRREARARFGRLTPVPGGAPPADPKLDCEPTIRGDRPPCRELTGSNDTTPEEPARAPSGDFDIRRYVPSLAHVAAYMSPSAAAERRRQARANFGRPTPLPGAAAELEATLVSAGVQAPSARGVRSGLDVVAPRRRTRARNVALGTICGLAIAATAVGMPLLRRERTKGDGVATTTHGVAASSAPATASAASATALPAASSAAPASPSAAQSAAALPERPRPTGRWPQPRVEDPYTDAAAAPAPALTMAPTATSAAPSAASAPTPRATAAPAPPTPDNDAEIFQRRKSP